MDDRLQIQRRTLSLVLITALGLFAAACGRSSGSPVAPTTSKNDSLENSLVEPNSQGELEGILTGNGFGGIKRVELLVEPATQVASPMIGCFTLIEETKQELLDQGIQISASLFVTDLKEKSIDVFQLGLWPNFDFLLISDISSGAFSVYCLVRASLGDQIIDELSSETRTFFEQSQMIDQID